jgi:glycosyltransferase involved in cell wall biosynthesis
MGHSLIALLLGVERCDTFDLYHNVEMSREYLARLRSYVCRFIIGDQQAHDFFVSQGIPEDKIIRIPQGLPKEALRMRARPPTRPVVDRPLRIGFVGRQDPDKGFHVLANAFDNLPESASVELWVVHATAATEKIVGDKFPSKDRFRSWVEKGRIRLFRPQTQEELYTVMAELDIGVIPSIQYETPCLVMLEMAAQGTPIIRSESKGMEHIIRDGVNGRTFPYGDAKSLNAILNEVLHIPEILDQWRQRLPAIFSDDEYAQKLIDVFRSIVAVSPLGKD